MEKVIETRVCNQCGSSFDITDKDREFYDKISPIFGGEKYSIPNPTLCPDCRQQRRLAWRNERKLYRRTCDASGKQIISIFSPDKPYKIYDQKIWRSDNRDPMEYGQEYDFSKTFFQQFDKLMKNVPLFSLSIFNSEDCDYTNATDGCKSSYMSFNIMQSNNLYYSAAIFGVSDACDIDLSPEKWSDIYQCAEVVSCKNSKYLLYCNYCSDSAFLYNCNNCTNCLMCYNLNNKKYCIENIQYSEQEYEEKKKTYTQMTSRDFFHKFIEGAVRRDCIIVNSENVTWSSIYNSKDIVYGFGIYDSENCRYCQNALDLKDSIDCVEVGIGSTLLYECHGINVTNRAIAANASYYSTDVFYTHNCYNSSNLFWCIGLRHKQYCIFNKQYTKEEYEVIVPKIIEHMQKNWERGEFFPASVSPFGYNETIAQEYFPHTKEQALSYWYKRMDQEFPINVPENAQTIKAQELPESIQDVGDDILNKVIICEVSGKSFRIVKPELEFYRKHNLPIPHKHPDIRHIERLQLRSPRKLWNRKCVKCWVNIKTTYSPERPEIIYCEQCYNKEIFW